MDASARLFGPVVGADDGLDEGMTDDIRLGELHEAESVDSVEDAHGVDEAALLVPGQVGLGDVPRDDRLRVVAEARQEHLHLIGRGVLGLVQDHERLSFSVRPRMNARGATSITSRSIKPLGLRSKSIMSWSASYNGRR